ncbi:hypothetical protein [Actinocorallia sp. A-T 12471]|uniref:hypothetical protein n=1 Tax=Actinocorallia sp. A-T 12471 TaxID=3089813 RepID=UPI0029D0EA3E|nr:hypothetical protein [Actinocorallia sp. A-T 12471]MDX6742373.1 hypothetical protein [Actinocorallia sp. A-T 12471]
MSVRRMLLLGYLTQAAVRFLPARHSDGPVADPDETGYLVAARLLAGGPGTDFTGHTFYQAGYPLLLAPLYHLTDDPETVYRLTLAVNALLGALTFPLVYLLLRRLGQVGGSALLTAWTAALLPATVLFTRYALADAILPTLLLTWLLALDHATQPHPATPTHRAPTRQLRPSTRPVELPARSARAVTRPGAVTARPVQAVPGAGALLTAPVWAAAWAGALAAGAAAVHARGAVVAVVHVAVLLVFAWRRPPVLGVGLGVLAVGWAAGRALNGYVAASLYPGGARDLGGLLADRMFSVDGQLWAWSGAAGQLWYLVVATWGLGGVGLVAVVAAVREPRFRAGAVALLAVTVGSRTRRRRRCRMRTGSGISPMAGT